MLPTHAELQSQAAAALDTTVDLKALCYPVKAAPGEAFYHTEAAIEAVDHPLDHRIGDLLLDIPEPDLISSQNPPSANRCQVLGCDPCRVANSVGKCFLGKTPFHSPHDLLGFQAAPMNETVTAQFFLARPMLDIKTTRAIAGRVFRTAIG